MTTTAPAQRRKYQLPFLLATLYLCWGSSFLAIELMVDGIPPLMGAGIRFTLAGTLLAMAVIPRRGWQQVIPRRHEIGTVVGLSILLITIGNGGVVVAQARGIPSWLAALLVATIPVWIALLRLGWGPRPHALVLAGTALGLGGTVILVSTYGFRVSGIVPIILALTGAFSWAVGAYLSTRRTGGGDDPWVISVRQLFIGGIGLLILCVLVESNEWSTIRWTPSAIGGLLWLTFASSIIAMLVFYRIASLSTVSTASTYAFTNPIVAMILSIVILNVWPDRISIIAAPLVILGVALVVFGDRYQGSRRAKRRH